MKRNILKLKYEQIKKLVENNSKLENYLSEALQDYYWYGEIDQLLNELKSYLKDYSIGFYNNNFIKIKDISEWNNWLTDITKILEPYLNDDELTYIKKLEKAQERFYNMSYDNKQYNNLEDYLYNQNQKINDILLRIFNDLTSYEIQEKYSLFGGF